MTALAVAYGAGLFEGEGTAHLSNVGQAVVQIQMTDREPIERMHAIFGGRIHGPYARGGKPVILWRLNGWTNLEWFYGLVREMLSPRRVAQFERILERRPPPETQGSGAHNRRKTQCVRGHALPPAAPGRKRRCRRCDVERRRERRATVVPPQPNPRARERSTPVDEASSAINAPHPDDAREEEEFFGGAESTGLPTLSAEQAAAEAARYAEEKGEEAPSFGEPAEEPQEPAPAAAEAQAAPAAAPAEEQLQGAAEAPSTAKAGGSPERDYVVLHRVPLTERLLEHLLKEVKSGNLAEPRVAFLELHHTTARNDRQAIGEAYKAHKDQLGEKCDLAAVTSRGFKVRHVEPRQRVEENLTIT